MKHTLKTTLYAFVCVTSLVTFLASCQKNIATPSPTSESHVMEPENVEVNVKKIEIDSVSENEKGKSLERAQQLAEEVQILESQKVYFNFDSSELKSEAKVSLKKKAEWLLNNPGYTMIIEGHCDERGPKEYNIALGKRRAGSARTFLESMGVPGSQVKSVSYGEERPADQQRHDKAWAKNRRDEFKLILEKASILY